MWARYVPFYLCQRMRRLRQQRFLTLSQRKKKVVSDPPEVYLNVSKQLLLNFHFSHQFKLDLVKMANLACDLLCQRMWRMGQKIASVDGAYGSNLLAYTAHAVAKPCKIVCFACIDGAYGSKLLNCQRMRRMWQHFASVDGACGINLLAQTAHAVAKTKWPVSHPSVKNVKLLFQPLFCSILTNILSKENRIAAEERELQKPVVGAGMQALLSIPCVVY